MERQITFYQHSTTILISTGAVICKVKTTWSNYIVWELFFSVSHHSILTGSFADPILVLCSLQHQDFWTKLANLARTLTQQTNPPPPGSQLTDKNQSHATFWIFCLLFSIRLSVFAKFLKQWLPFLDYMTNRNDIETAIPINYSFSAVFQIIYLVYCE